MFNHVMVGSNDISRSRAFYDAVLAPMGLRSEPIEQVAAYRSEHGNFVAIKPRDGKLATISNGATVGFRAASPAAVDAFHAAGLANGGTCEGPPGVREESPGRMYGAYLRDPDGNKICAFAPNNTDE